MEPSEKEEGNLDGTKRQKKNSVNLLLVLERIREVKRLKEEMNKRENRGGDM